MASGRLAGQSSTCRWLEWGCPLSSLRYPACLLGYRPLIGSGYNHPASLTVGNMSATAYAAAPCAEGAFWAVAQTACASPHSTPFRPQHTVPPLRPSLGRHWLHAPARHRSGRELAAVGPKGPLLPAHCLHATRTKPTRQEVLRGRLSCH